MHVVRKKAGKEILCIDYAKSETIRKGEEIYPSFDATTMEVGWTDGRHVPVCFDISAAGRIVPPRSRSRITSRVRAWDHDLGVIV